MPMNEQTSNNNEIYELLSQNITLNVIKLLSNLTKTKSIYHDHV